MKQLMLGNEAVARGLYEAGCVFVSSYPGTPSTEITEYASKFPEIYTEWAPNEKVALEAALGAAVSGGRAFCAMKHVGLNVAADPLFISSYTGINGGLVIAVADDPGMHSSQNEQDSRHYAIAAKLPMLEPSDSGECLSFIKLAFEISEQFDTPVLLRMSTRIAHSQSIVQTADREEHPFQEYKKDPSKYVMMPANARGRHIVVEQRIEKLCAFADEFAQNRIELHTEKIGIICAGTTYPYAKEAFGNTASFLKLGMVFPMPERMIRDFCSKMERVIVIEELDPVVENACKAWGLRVEGKNLLPSISEFSQEVVAKCVLGEQAPYEQLDLTIPARPPAMCPGCPHRGLFYVLKKMGLTVSGDIGCYTLGAAPPLAAMDSTFCMGASISALHGMNKLGGIDAHKSVAVIGDSTFAHSGLTGLMNMTYNKAVSTVIISDNSITGMTGHQQNPTTGKTITGEPTLQIDIESVCRALGVTDVKVVDPNDLAGLESALEDSLARKEVSVIIARRMCVLLKEVKKDTYDVVDPDKCRSCRACMRIGCPAVSMVAGKAEIDTSLCTGCGLCADLCRFDAIHSVKW